MTDALALQLRDLYAAPSKHHRYQSVPDFVTAATDYCEPIDEGWRGDRCRLEYLRRTLPCETLTSLTDIGANTGYFALSLAHAFPNLAVTALEPNAVHADFIRAIASAFALPNLAVRTHGVTRRSLADEDPADAALLLNVLHHAGYDFDTDLPRTREAFTAYAIDFLTALADVRRHLVFQMGSNWGGDTANPLVPRDAHADKLRYFAALLRSGGWTITRVAYPTRAGSAVTYDDLPDPIVATLNDDSARLTDDVLMAALDPFDLGQFPGEFYKRPLFTCLSTRPPGRSAS